MKDDKEKIRLRRKRDQVLAKLDDGAEEKPVKIAWVRPVSGRGREVSVLDAESKNELVMLGNLDRLNESSRKIAEEELGRRYLVPRITRIIRTDVSFGNWYLEVETDLGHRRFLMKDPNTSVVRVTDDTLLIRDVIGNRYEIESLARLDEHSRVALDRII
jgi:hypothetical protein